MSQRTMANVPPLPDRAEDFPKVFLERHIIDNLFGVAPTA
jgi:hypothetical protein